MISERRPTVIDAAARGRGHTMECLLRPRYGLSAFKPATTIYGIYILQNNEFSLPIDFKYNLFPDVFSYLIWKTSENIM